jgi:SAM-dependent methyltransferase
MTRKRLPDTFRPAVGSIPTDPHESAKAVWGRSPAGSKSAPQAHPGSPEFFEQARKKRSTYEMPWLKEIVPFAEFAGRAVLEIGSGVGFDAYDFVQNNARYVGIDIAPENIDRAQAHLESVGLTGDFRVAAAERLPFADGSFDIVYSNGVLHHLPDPREGIDEAYRVLRPGGNFWLIVYNKSSVFYWLTLFLGHYLLGREFRRYKKFQDRLAAVEFTTSPYRPIVHAFTKRRLARNLRDSGFVVDTIWVRKLTREDLPDPRYVSKLWRWVPEAWLDTIGRHYGWYLVSRATKPR